MMKYLRWISMIMVLCGAMVCVTTVEAAQTQKVAVKKEATKKESAKKAASTTAPSHKKQSAVTKKTTADKTKASHKRSTKNAKNTKKTTNKKQAVNVQAWIARSLGQNELLGKASWYGERFHGGNTASGVEYDMYTYTAAHRTLPLGTVVEVTDEYSGKKVMVCINNRGPFKKGRIIDLSYAAASELGIDQRGVAPVNLRVVSNAEGQSLNEDEAFYVQLERQSDTFSTKDASVGPYAHFADASVMKEVLRKQYPEAVIVLGPGVASRE